VLGVATAVVVLGASVAPFLAPPVVRFEQDRTGAGALTGYSPAQLDVVTGSLLGDVVLWQGDFAVAIDGVPVLKDAERSHLRDVRTVFTGFWLMVLAGVVTLAIGFRRAHAMGASAAAWRAVRNGARGLAIGIAVAGVLVIVAFEAAFEVFHRLFFSTGTYTFDPARDKLVQLFPEQLWSEMAIAVGAVALGAALVTAWRAGTRA
jgi:integral membrane protein (TIGR01906 family)